MTLRFGRYETLRAIASGGMATVYLGRALGAGGFERLVAIKVMHPHIADDPDFVDMFLDEARLAARVRHPNVVATIDVQQVPAGESSDGTTGPQLFIVMEYIEGPSLQLVQRELRKGAGLVPLGTALRVFLDALEGLHAAHELKDGDGVSLQLIHRDVSPQNLLVGSDGITRITDFGVARAESRLSSTRGGQIKGKIAYMAPEQIRAEPIDRRCDIYAAGVLLWELLVGQRLFRAENDGAMVAKILQGAPRSPRSFNPDIPPELDAVCMRALRIKPEERWATAAAFAEALEEAAGADGVTIAPSRTVAAWIKAMDLMPAPVDLPKTLRPPPLPGATGVSLASTPPPPDTQATPDTSASSNGPSKTTEVGAVVSFAPPPVRKKGVYAVGGVALVAIGAALFLAGRMAGSNEEPNGGPNVAGTGEAAALPATNAPPEAQPGSASDAAPAPSADPSGTPSGSAAVAPPVRPAGAGGPYPRPLGKPNKPPVKPPGTGTSFRPNDL